jgi:hypothetical protein
VGAAGTSWAGPGAIIGAIVGALGGIIASVATGSSSDAEEKVMEELASIYSAGGNKAADMFTDKKFEEILREDLNLNDEALINSLIENRDKV